MLGDKYDDQNCSAARALEIVGERWSLLILRDALFRGFTRFSEFQRSLGVASNILSKRLDGFVGAGLMTSGSEAHNVAQHQYVLTEKGLDFAPVVIALTAWGDRWAAPKGPPVVLEHRICGGTIQQDIRCTRCGASPNPNEIAAHPTGAGAKAHRPLRPKNDARHERERRDASRPSVRPKRRSVVGR